MKDIILFFAGGFAGLALIPIMQIIRELRECHLEDTKAQQLRDKEEVSFCAGCDEYYD